MRGWRWELMSAGEGDSGAGPEVTPHQLKLLKTLNIEPPKLVHHAG